MPEHEISNSVKVFLVFISSHYYYFFYKNLKVPRFQRFRGHSILSLVTPSLDWPPDI